MQHGRGQKEDFLLPSEGCRHSTDGTRLCWSEYAGEDLALLAGNAGVKGWGSKKDVLTDVLYSDNAQFSIPCKTYTLDISNSNRSCLFD